MASSRINSIYLGPIWVQSGNGNPDHFAQLGSQYTDLDNALIYSNIDGINTWSTLATTDYADAKVQDVIVDGVSGIAPSQNVVYDKLLLKQNLPTGFISGLPLSIKPSDNTKAIIGNGIYTITDFTILSAITVHIINVATPIEFSPQFLLTNPASYVALDINQNIVQSASPFTNEDRRTLALVGAVIHSNNININVTNEIKAPIVGPTNQLHDMIKAVGSLNLDGNIYSPNGANLQLNKSLGTIWGLGINASNYLNPHVLTISAQTSFSFNYRLRTSFQYSATTSIDPNNYDNAGILTAVPNNRYTIQRINLFQSGISILQYGQNIYQTLDEAKTFLSTESFVTEQNISDNAIFRAYLIVKKGITNLSTAISANDAFFVPVDKFGNSVGGSSLSTLQSAYDNSTTPEIITNASLGPLSIKNGVGTSDSTTTLFEGISSGGTITSRIYANGDVSFIGSVSGTSFIKSGGTSSQFLKADGSVDANTYQISLINPILGIGTTNTLPKFTGATGIGNSNIIDDGSLIRINSNTNISGGTTISKTNTLASTNGTHLVVNGTITASSGGARSISSTYISPTLVAANNNDVMIGLDISPTFTNSSFTGLTNIGAKIKGSVVLGNLANNGRSDIGLNVVGAIDNSGIGITSSTGRLFSIENTNSTTNSYATMALRVDATGAAVFSDISLIKTGTGLGMLRVHQQGIQQLGLFTSGNLLLQNGGTFTDSGFRLDVSGTTRLGGIMSAATALARGTYINPTLIATANNDSLVGLDISPTFTNGAFTGITNTIVRGIGGGIRAVRNSSNLGQYIEMDASNGAAGTLISYSAVNNPKDLVLAATTNSANATPPSGGNNIFFRIRATNVQVMHNSTNVSIASNTDYGAKLEVVGTSRFTGNMILNSTGVNISTQDNGVDKLQVNGSLIATTIKKSGGTSSQFLKADGSVDTNPPQIRISASTDISSVTLDASGFGQNGRNVIIDNTTGITFTTSASSETNFTARYLKHGVSAVTFSAGVGTSIVQLNATLLMDGGAGSQATLTRVDNTFYLGISNI